jgi:hypothetical protein
MWWPDSFVRMTALMFDVQQISFDVMLLISNPDTLKLEARRAV